MTTPSATQAAAAAHQAAAELAGVQWDQTTGQDTLEAVVALGQVKAMVEAALVGAAERLDLTGCADSLGWASTKDFLTHVLGGRKGAGAGYLRVAQQTAEMPAVREAMGAGKVSLAQAGVIGRDVATLPFHQPLRDGAAIKLLALVVEEGLDATDLDHRFGGVVKELDPDGTLLGADQDRDKSERGAHAARFFSIVKDDRGGGRLKGYGTAEDLELIKTTLMPLAAPVTSEPGACGGDPTNRSNREPETGRRIGHSCPDPTCFHDGKDHRDHGARMFDALVEACRRLQHDDALPHAHGTTARITLTASYDILTRAIGDGLLPDDDQLSAQAVRKLACDAEIIPAVLGTHAEVLDLGRTHRLVSTGLWNALVLRDRHCAFPGCDRLPIACDAHHITHWADGGPTGLDNLVLLCRKHHTVVHNTPWTLAVDPVTRRPVWQPPPLIDDTDRWTYHPGTPPRRQRPPEAA